MQKKREWSLFSAPHSKLREEGEEKREKKRREKDKEIKRKNKK